MTFIKFDKNFTIATMKHSNGSWLAVFYGILNLERLCGKKISQQEGLSIVIGKRMNIHSLVWLPNTIYPPVIYVLFILPAIGSTFALL